MPPFGWKTLWHSLFLLATCTGGTMAAESPTIRSSTIQIHTDGTISFQFEAPSGEMGGLQLQTADRLGDGTAWKLHPQAAITELFQGMHQAVLSANPDGRVAFYRILATQSADAPLFINEVMPKNLSKVADADGKYWDWIEIFNPADTAVDLRGYGLTDDESRPHQWQFPRLFLQPDSFVLVFASGLDRSEPGKELHASFRLNAGGDQLFLTAPDGRTLDQVQLPALAADQSVGRLPDGDGAWQIFAKPLATPRAPNFFVSTGPLIQPPRFSIERRFHPRGTVLNLELQRAIPGPTIRFTIDGSPVTAASLAYNAPIILKRTTVVRAASFEGDRASAETARTYFIGAEHKLPVISLAAPPGNFEFRNGFLYGMGNALGSSGQVLQSFPFSGSNAWKDREIEVSFEFYEPNHEPAFHQRAGLKIFGGWGSRGYPQKSFALFARSKYGDGKINYPIFPDKPIESFETLVLRNSGNDNQSTHQTPPRPPISGFGATASYGSYFVNGSFTLMRDAMMQELIKETGLDTQAYRPAVLYINGDYWGIYNLREKINEHYVVANHGIAKNQIDLIEAYGTVQAGDSAVYRAMRDFLASRDLANPTNYATVAEKYLQIDNFIDYHLAVIYFQNFDIGNIKCWRPRTPTGRFRWIVYDQDYGFNLWNPEVYLPAMKRDYADYDNMFKFYTAGSGTGTGWPNEGGRTLLLRRLLMNAAFKERFIRRCADLLNGPFREERVVQKIQAVATVIRPEIARHLDRWNWPELQKRGFGRPHQPEYQPFTPETWEKNLQVLLDFAWKRPAKLRQDCISHFRLQEGLAEVTLNVAPSGSGRVRVDTHKHSGSVKMRPQTSQPGNTAGLRHASPIECLHCQNQIQNCSPGRQADEDCETSWPFSLTPAPSRRERAGVRENILDFKKLIRFSRC
ncbi:MAG: CotH kinase family protein [Verrucomicrobia bacterium]|nr:CotH kinase family protein [Verrucomicrobiota bacterium]